MVQAMIDGKDLYEQHRDDIESYGIPKPPPWGEISRHAKIGWESAASELAQKMLSDREQVTE